MGVPAQTFGDKRFVSVPYSERPVVIFCSSTHRFARRRSIRAAELQGEKLILREPGSTTRKAIEAALKLRQYLPKGIDISSYSQAKLNAVARQLNERPRKTLGYHTPAEMFSQTVALTG